MSDYEPIEELPPITPRMLDVLTRVFPDRPATPETSERHDLYHAGQRSVIEFLRKAQADQIERANDGPPS